ncbi:hypothetical protein Esti_000144 [Eimeria stiedai]
MVVFRLPLPRTETRVLFLSFRGFSVDTLAKRALSSAWHPRTDGQMERTNRTVGQMLRTYIQSREEEWPDLLPALELACNCTRHSATGLSPFEVMLGENPLRPQDLHLVDVFPPTPTPPMTRAFRLLLDRASAHLEQAKLLPTHPTDHLHFPPPDVASTPEWGPTDEASDGLPIYEWRASLISRAKDK